MSEVVLVKYDAMLSAIAEAKAVDEILEIENVAEAMRQAARVSGNTGAELDMAEIRFRAERRLGELMALQREAGLMAKGTQNTGGSASRPAEKPITLAELGVGKAKADRARKMAAVPKAEFEGLVQDYRTRVEEEGQRTTVTLLKAGEKAMSRQDKFDSLAAKIAAAAERLPGMGPFGLIYADPPWQFETRSELGMDRSEANHYPTMSTPDIIALQPPSFDHSACGLWATSPMLDQGVDVLRGWGFAYKASAIWRKYGAVEEGTGSGIGRGYWFRVDHEILLLGTKGTVPAPEPANRHRSVIAAAPGANSAKPLVFRQLMESYFPSVPKLEMFAREAEPVPGWDIWGAEADGAVNTSGSLRVVEQIALSLAAGQHLGKPARRKPKDQDGR